MPELVAVPRYASWFRLSCGCTHSCPGYYAVYLMQVTRLLPVYTYTGRCGRCGTDSEVTWVEARDA
jgi:hypothetical protein